MFQRQPHCCGTHDRTRRLISDTNRSLNGNLQRVLHKALLADVVRQRVSMRERPQLCDAGFDLSELFRDQLRIGHRDDARGRRYSSSIGRRSKYSFRARTSNLIRSAGTRSRISAPSRNTR